MVKVKLCGNQTLEDVQMTSGADAQGFIVMADSSREIDPEKAAELIQEVALFTTSVLVTTVTDPLLIADMVEVLIPDALQVHVELSPIKIERIRRALETRTRLYPVLGIGEDLEASKADAMRIAESDIDGLLLDSRVGVKMGGTGETHRWDISAAICELLDPLPVILAGGITPENVAEAIETVRPYAVDLASGIETNGKKDPAKVQALLKQVRQYEH